MCVLKLSRDSRREANEIMSNGQRIRPTSSRSIPYFTTSRMGCPINRCVCVCTICIDVKLHYTAGARLLLLVTPCRLLPHRLQKVGVRVACLGQLTPFVHSLDFKLRKSSRQQLRQRRKPAHRSGTLRIDLCVVEEQHQ